MKQVVVLSGKGGTGKTSLTASFAHLAASASGLQTVLVDADVDAANLELVLAPQVIECHEFIGGKVAVIDELLCQRCALCEVVCRFDAILPEVGNQAYRVDPIACEGCAACAYQCPEGAVQMRSQVAGAWMRSDSRYGPLFHAALFPGQENSGKLVALVKQQAREYASKLDEDLLLVDGPPGIGCPVISAVSGADLALVVVEPTLAGIHDMRRVIETCGHFNVPALVVINKADLFEPGCQEIEAYCQESSLCLVGKVPFDLTVTQAMLQAEPVTKFAPQAPASQALRQIWGAVIEAYLELFDTRLPLLQE